MEYTTRGGPLVVGVGNPYRHDDGVGPAVTALLRTRAGSTMAIVDASGEGARLLGLFEQSSWVIVIDAIASGATPGRVFRIDAVAEPLPDRYFRYSTHAFGVAEAVELARALGRLPACLVIFGVEGGEFGAGVGLTPVVERAAKRVVKLVLKEACTIGARPPTKENEG